MTLPTTHQSIAVMLDLSHSFYRDVKLVAVRAGFAGFRYMATVFREQVGSTPTTFREQNRKKV
jgi:transcriptional regulator GlxA family with amidase domain